MAKLILVPNSPYVVLEGDTSLGLWAMERGTIVGLDEIHELACVRSLRAGDVVIDCGAFVGDTTRLFLDYGATVYAFEPCRDAYEALKHNCPEAIHFNVAVGDGTPMNANGTYGEDNGNAGTRMVSIGEGKPSFRIDDLELAEVRLAKYDLEGCEGFALRGSAKTIARCKPTMIIEVYDTLLTKQGSSRKVVTDLLGELDYNYEVCIGRWEDDRCDLLCTPR